MKQCDRFWNGIVEIASGQENPAAQAHLDACEACGARFIELRRVLSALAVQVYNAPADQIAMAASLMPAPIRRRFLAHLLGNSLATAGARAAEAEAFQLVYAHDDVQARLMYTRIPEGWEVMGRTPDGWSPSRRGEAIAQDEEGRFSFRVGDLADSGLILVREDIEIELPSAQEAWNGGSD
jgi:hypothetical protein